MSTAPTQNYIPTISWYQNNLYVFCDIMIPDVENMIFDVESHEENAVFLFEGDKDGKHYLVCFELYGKVIDAMSTRKKTETCVKVALKKETDNEEWPRLQKNKDLYKGQIKVNWDKMEFEDTDEVPSDYADMLKQKKMFEMMNGKGHMADMMGGEDDEGSGMDMAKMMQMMGGMGGGGAPGGMDMSQMMKMMGGMGGEGGEGGMDMAKMMEMMGGMGGEGGEGGMDMAKMMEMMNGMGGDDDDEEYEDGEEEDEEEEEEGEGDEEEATE
jgi:hypothetical protein